MTSVVDRARLLRFFEEGRRARIEWRSRDSNPHYVPGTLVEAAIHWFEGWDSVGDDQERLDLGSDAREPTDEMLDAGLTILMDRTHPDVEHPMIETVREIYKAMKEAEK